MSECLFCKIVNRQIPAKMVYEDERVVVIRPPTANEGAVTIRKNDIRTRALSKTSNMPTGTLNTLGETQILDLLAYLISEGNSENPAFHSAPARRTIP